MRGERTPGAPQTRRRKPRRRGSVSVGNSSTDGKFASLATSCESYSGTRGASLRAVKQEEEASVDSGSSSCSSKLAEWHPERRPSLQASKLAECHSERRPSLRAVKQEEPEASVDSESSSCSSKLAECHSERRPSLQAVKQEEPEASVDSESSSCSSKLAECHSERRPSLRASKLAECHSERRPSFRAVKQEEPEASVDSESSSCGLKLAECHSDRRPSLRASELAECHSERRPSLRAVKQEEPEASVDSESSSCSSKLAECHSDRRPSLRASELAECHSERRPSLRAVKQEEPEASVDSESSSCSSKLAECHSDRRPSLRASKLAECHSEGRPSLRAVKQEEPEASVDSESSSCSSKLAECHSERRPSLRASKLAECYSERRPSLRASKLAECYNERRPSLPAVKQEAEAFDICVDESKHVVTLQPSLFALNREKRRNREQKKYLRPGMVLLKGFIGHLDQVSIIKECRELGIGAGGFYTPGYSDGGKLHLQMMCLGKNWDPETSSYEEKRFFDGAVPPKIPQLFKKLVENAIQASHCFLRQENGVFNVEEELPYMSPDICIVNFYSNSGKLGLHQDKDESKSSLVKGLPVVSFSLGDSAEFLYGVERDVNKAERVELESGDVLLFGGKSRHIFHGVPCIKTKTAPQRLIKDSKLRPGRLNLTFRQY